MDDRNRPGESLEFLTRFGQRLSRRDVLKRAMALGLSAPAISALLAACGGDDDDDDNEQPTATAGGGGNTTASPTAAGGGGAATATTSSAPTATTGGGAPAGGTLVVGRNVDDLITWDPGILYEISTAPITWSVYQAMVIQDIENLNSFLPVLCEEVPTVENGGISADGLKYTFKLKKGIKFHTGGEMKAADWVFATKRLAYLQKNPSFLTDPIVTKDADGNITAVNVAALDDYTVEYTLGEPNVAFMAYMAGQLAFVYDSEFVKEQGALDTPEAATDDTAQAWFDQNSAGVGPYKITSFKDNEETVLERFDGYYGEPVAFDKIVYKYLENSGRQLEELQGGAIDFAMELDADAIASLDKDNFEVVEGALLNHVYIAMMIGDPDIAGPLADVKVRQAIAYAIDYDAYVNELRGGAAVRPASAVPNGMLGTDKVQNLQYVEDLDKAKQLLQEAGVAEGMELTLSFGASSSYEGVPNETTCAKLQADLDRIGITVNLNPMNPDQRLDDFRNAKLQFTISEWGPDYLDVHAYAFPFGGVPDQAPSKRIKYVNEENVALLADGIKEQDQAKREEIYVQVETNMINDCGFVPLWQPVSQYAVRKGLTGVVIHPGPLTLLDRIKPV
jgi:peptide/nickel transport system substrate-binding protein